MARRGSEGKRSLMEMHVLGLRLFHPVSLGTFFLKESKGVSNKDMDMDGWGRMDAVLAWRCAVCMVSLCLCVFVSLCRAFASTLRGERG
jgi:hypothetical protein